MDIVDQTTVWDVDDARQVQFQSSGRAPAFVTQVS